MCISACMLPGLILIVADIVFGIYLFANMRKKKTFKQYALVFAALLLVGLYLSMGCDPIQFVNCNLFKVGCTLCT